MCPTPANFCFVLVVVLFGVQLLDVINVGICEWSIGLWQTSQSIISQPAVNRYFLAAKNWYCMDNLIMNHLFLNSQTVQKWSPCIFHVLSSCTRFYLSTDLLSRCEALATLLLSWWQIGGGFISSNEQVATTILVPCSKYGFHLTSQMRQLRWQSSGAVSLVSLGTLPWYKLFLSIKW